MLQNVDDRIFIALNSPNAHPSLLNTAGILLAGYSPALPALVLLCLWFRHRDEPAREQLLLAPYTILLAMFFAYLITLLTYRPRPFMVGLGNMLITHLPETSFPSDHATLLFSSACTLLALRKFRIFGVWLFAVAVLGGGARVFIGVHYPSDILGSLAISLLAMGIVFTARDRLAPFTKALLKLSEKLFPCGGKTGEPPGLEVGVRQKRRD